MTRKAGKCERPEADRPTPAAERQRQYRARRGAGRVALRVVVDEVAVAEAMIAAHFLPASLADDRKALAAAVERLLATVVVTDLVRDA